MKFYVLTLSTRLNLYVLQLCTSFLITYFFLIHIMYLASLLYLPLVSGDNKFICSSSVEIITLSASRQSYISYLILEK
jgi:hypothetical protein